MSAGFWVKMRRSLSSDPDVFRIGELTKLDRFSVVGRLHAVWSWADEHDVAKRDAVTVTTAYVDSVADCVGFAQAMRQVGWLAGSDGALLFPNFERHRPHCEISRCDRGQSHLNLMVVAKGVALSASRMRHQRRVKRTQKRREQD